MNGCFAMGNRKRFSAMRLYAPAELHDPDAIELFNLLASLRLRLSHSL